MSPAEVAPVDGSAPEIPLVVEIAGGGRLRPRLALRPAFDRPGAAVRRREVTLRLVAAAPVTVAPEGAAAVTLAPGETVALALTGRDALRLAVGDGPELGRLTVPIDDRPAAAPAETWQLPGGTAWVLPAPGRDTVRTPLLAVEGFPGNHGYLYSHDVFAQHGVLDALRARGWDVVIVGLSDGARPIAESASVLRAALAMLAERTPLPVTMLGWSLGGLIARAALCAMETDGEHHRVETLITWDTPHRGAITEPAAQWLAVNFAEVVPALRPFRALLESPANRELDLLSVAQGATAAVPDERRTALEAALGWPATSRRILLSSGRGDGGNALEPGRVLVHWTGENGEEITLRAPGGPPEVPLAAGTLAGATPPPLRGDDLPAWAGVPGGRAEYAAGAAAVLAALGGRLSVAHTPATCAIPTVSALDLDGAPDAPVPAHPPQAATVRITCAEDNAHLVIDAGAAAALLATVGAPLDPAHFDPANPGFLADPFPALARLRSLGPVQQIGGSVWCLDAASCRSVLTDPDRFRKHPPAPVRPPVGPQVPTAGARPSLFSSDPPDHAALRRAAETPLRAAAEQAGALARSHAAAQLAALGETECLEIVSDFALPVPAAVLFDLLGIPAEPVWRRVLTEWQATVTAAHAPGQPLAAQLRGATCALALRGAFGAMVERHRLGEPAAGLTGALATTFSEAGLTDGQLAGTLCDLLIAGYLSTTFLIATGTLRLLENPAELARLRAAPSLLAPAVEELLRSDGPVMLIDRYAADDTEIAGLAVPAGTHVLAAVGAAGRDPELAEDPDAIRIDRGAASLAFGDGIHACVGAPIARAVAPAALGELLARYGQIELDGEPSWQGDPYLHSVTSLPVRVRR